MLRTVEELYRRALFSRRQLDAHLDTLVSEQASFVLARSGLAYIYNTVQQHQPKLGPLSAQENMDAISIRSAMVRFDGTI